MLTRSFFASILAVMTLVPSVLLGADTAPRFQRDIAVYDRILAQVKPGQTTVRFGDVGMTVEQLRSLRARLARAALDPETDMVTPGGTAFKWPGGNVYYRFDPTQVGNGTITAGKMQQFRDGVAEWSGWANLNFIENISGQPNYITVQEDPGIGGGFSSSVGMAGGEQFVAFGPNAWNRGTVCHEVGHAIGLWHEQQRSDRDTYVVIHWENIDDPQEGNFTIVPGSQTFGTAYDFYSVMHYARNALSSNTQDTITMQPAYAQFINIIGQVYDRTLSKIERAGMAAIYGAPAIAPSATVTNTKDSGSGSLRNAVYYAFDRSTDAMPVPTTVVFNIGGSPVGGVFTIKPTYELPAPGANTTIDGNTQTLFSGDTNPDGPEVVIDGSQIGAQNLNLFARAFTLREQGCTIKNLVINGFNTQGLAIDGTRAAFFGGVAMGNTISGCYIGTDKSGTVGIGNGLGWPGIEIFGGAHHNTIGGLTTAARNVISGSSGHGVIIQQAGSNNNLVVGNYIGTNATGTGPLSNAYAGVALYGGAQNNTIGGLTSSARNVISGNKLQGFLFADLGTNGNAALGNYVGLNAAGTAALANGNADFATHSFYPGAAIFNGAKNNTIGGTATGSANVISGNTAQGIAIADNGTDGNLVQGNLIGLNAAGTAAIRNGFADPTLPSPYYFGGVSIFGGAKNNIIGGASAGAANVISGNTAQGVTISGAGSNGNLVQGNYIGTNPAGTAAIGNGFADPPNNWRFGGVDIFGGAQSNTIGGTTAAAANVISGNSASGITIANGGTSLNLVQGNYLGTNKAGTNAIPNGFEGVSVFGGPTANTIGGNVPGAGNVISGNSFRGVAFFDAATTGNFVQGNLIGLNGAGSGSIPNGFSGVEFFLASNNTIGGTSPGARNYISGNSGSGVVIDGADATGNKVIGNTIGRNKTGAVSANGSQGVTMFTGAHGNFIGGSLAGESNVISGNSAEGIALFDASTLANTISRNSIYMNAFTGIGLYTNSNNNQPAPILSSAVIGPVGNIGGTNISGSIVGAARVEFFANPSGDDEGRYFLGFIDAPGGNFTVPLASALSINHIITATATASGSTSQFSNTIGATVTDSDGDGIPDNYENANGLNAGAIDAALDLDGDGLTNEAEYRAGTSPQSGSSRFAITAVTRAGNDFGFTFNSIAGKTYRIESKDDIAQATWSLVQDQVLATSPSTTITDVGAAVLPRRFYRAVLEP